jgi:hypothetical protein
MARVRRYGYIVQSAFPPGSSRRIHSAHADSPWAGVRAVRSVNETDGASSPIHTVHGDVGGDSFLGAESKKAVLSIQAAVVVRRNLHPLDKAELNSAGESVRKRQFRRAHDHFGRLARDGVEDLGDAHCVHATVPNPDGVQEQARLHFTGDGGARGQPLSQQPFRS